MNTQNDKEGLDLIGIGKLAKAIPDDVYTQTTEVATTTFTKLIAPITESTSGLGRYIKQKFDNMVEVEQALAAYSVQNAITKAEVKANNNGTNIINPTHPKSFIRAIEESSKETDPTLHTMWENLIADQLVNINFHPHFVEILPHFSPIEANILVSLLNKEDTGIIDNSYLGGGHDWIRHWVRKEGETTLNKWTYSCVLLTEFQFADILPPKNETYNKGDKVTILYRTKAGNAFLETVAG